MPSSILLDFLAAKGSARSLFPLSYLDADHRRKALEQAKQRRVDPIVIDLLRKQNGALSKQGEAALNLLSSGQAVCVVTGQQIGVLGGPAFTLYKALSAVKLARVLSQELNYPVVPIFWLQSEDHDFDEIKTVNFFGLEDQVRSAHLPLIDGAGDSVGAIKLERSAVEQLRADLESMLPPSLVGGDLWSLLWRAYAPGQTLAQAFVALIGGVLGETGLLTFDCSNREIKQRFKEIYSSAEIGRDSIERGLLTRAEQLSSFGYSTQVGIKRGSPLFFISLDGKRQRITAAPNGDYTYEQGAFTKSLSKEQLYQILDLEPERFTCSALLRPILQDKIFPTLAYVAGPAEFSYWAELEPVYRFFKLPLPLVVPRAHFTLIDHRHRERMQKLQAGNEILKGDYRGYVAERALHLNSAATSKLDQIIERSVSDLAALNIQAQPRWLEKAKQRTISSISRSGARFRYKLERALVDQDRTLKGIFERSKRYYYPLGAEQERIISWISFLLRDSFSLVDKILNAIDPFDRTTKELVID